ncbi:MAG: sugar-binding protein [Acidobacteriota bacterium]|nr:sugar-binding protein [Acidobacteriota bacterium]
MKKSALALAACLAACALLCGCARRQSPPAAGKRLRLAFVTNNASDYWTIARRGTEKADQELENVDVEFRIDSDGSAAEQKRIVDDLLARGVDGMAISPVDPSNQTQMIDDAARRVLVITQDSDAPQSARACYIGTDNLAAGRQAGELVRAALPQGGKIMVFVGKADAQNARERLEGVKEAIAGSRIEIIDVRTDEADPMRARSNAADTLERYPEVSALVGLWAYNGPAILSAVKDANKVGRVKIIAFDGQDETLAGVREGSIEGTVVQQPYQFGYQSVKIMARIIGGDRSMIPAGKQIFVPTRVIRKENVDDFIKEINQLRSRS